MRGQPSAALLQRLKFCVGKSKVKEDAGAKTAHQSGTK